MARLVSERALEPRDPSNKTNDIAAIRVIAQAAVEVELFTIPLYMTSLYSIFGNHEINARGNSLYKGWIWPGPAPTAEPSGKYEANERAFNILYSVFVEEMLHLQLAANMASAIGQAPRFTGPPLQTPANGWICYGPHLTIIPHVIDLTDTVNAGVAVNIGPLDAERVALFRIIEQPDRQAYDSILPDRRLKYFPEAPFANWQAGQPLPLFGTIGHMYQCYYDYLHVSYTDGTTLWDAVLTAGAIQRDYFNRFDTAPQNWPQYGFDLILDTSDAKGAFGHMCKMMDAITDQGEGSTLDPLPDPHLLTAVEPEFQAIKPNLENIYPSFDSNGVQLAESDKANARCDTDADDHYERFGIIEGLLGDIVTCDKAGKVGNWTAADFVAPPAAGDPEQGGPVPNPHNLPSQQDLADAWNTIAREAGTYHPVLNTAVIGAIAGMTGVLDSYWQAGGTDTFPSPAMGGTGDRMATLWASLGQTPDLSLGIGKLPDGTLGHSCQGLDYNANGRGNDCADPRVFHSCIGSNNCHAEGGCGFVNDGTGGSCGGPKPPQASGTCGGPRIYASPGDNKCRGFGGCAVPISASQLYPKPTQDAPGDEWLMSVYDFVPSDGPDDGYNGWKSVQVGSITYKEGDKVDDVAFRAFAKVMESRKVPTPDVPKPNVLRLVFPPST